MKKLSRNAPSDLVAGRKILRLLGMLSAIGLFFLLAKFGLFLFELGTLVTDTFPRDHGLPSGIYARPLSLYRGLDISPDDLELELTLLRYREIESIDTSGSFYRTGGEFTIFTRSFQFEDGEVGPQRIRITIKSDRVESIVDLSSGRPVKQLRMEPLLIGDVLPLNRENRGFIRIEEIPMLLARTIMAVEDRDFYTHYGVDFSALLRALIINIQKGQVVQGGSTITQQLARFLLTSKEKTIKRKLDELLMALFLESVYSKDEILEAYINAVYLGQDGRRAIHGFAEAGLHYFGRDIRELHFQEIALLVGMLKGPSYYDPLRYPKRARDRRAVILDVMAQQQLISYEQAGQGGSSAISLHSARTKVSFPAVTDLVRRRFRDIFSAKAVRGSGETGRGYRIFTTCDPIIQLRVERAVASAIDTIASRHKLEKEELETGVVVVTASGCEALAIVGGRNARFAGFNRALDAKRPVGSLIKPAYFLAALERPERYNLMTLIDDSVPDMDLGHDHGWRPRNFAPVYHGRIPLYLALTQSINVASVRLGLELGLDECILSIRKLGFQGDIPPFPSTLLGSVAMSPVEVAGMYHTFSSAGFNAPMRVIRTICDREGRVIKQYPQAMRRRIPPGPVYLLNVILQKVVSEGTVSRVGDRLVKDLRVAGKTGSSDQLRDSWFAGFTGDTLAVVWLGKDDFEPVGLTGADGAFTIWEEVMGHISHTPLAPPVPDSVKWIDVDPVTGFRIDEKACEVSVAVPYLLGYGPRETIPCDEAKKSRKAQLPFQLWLKKVFN